jgi:predicted Zn-dependent peptidase
VLVLVGVAGLAACAAGIAGLDSRQLDFGPRLEVQRLRSGMQLVVGHDDRSPLVAVSLVVGAGAAHDPPGKAGLAHLVEHLSYEGRIASGLSIREQLRPLGDPSDPVTTSRAQLRHLTLDVPGQLAQGRSLPDAGQV